MSPKSAKRFWDNDMHIETTPRSMFIAGLPALSR